MASATSSRVRKRSTTANPRDLYSEMCCSVMRMAASWCRLLPPASSRTATVDDSRSAPASMKPPVESIYDPAAVRRRDRVPSYIWTGHEIGGGGRVLRPNGIKPNWHLILVLSGQASFRQPGMERLLGPGDLIL